MEVRDTGTTKGQAIYASQAFRRGDVVLAELPILWCRNSNDGHEKCMYVVDAFFNASTEVQMRVCGLVPPVDETHSLFKTATEFAESQAHRGDVTVIRNGILAFMLTAFEVNSKESSPYNMSQSVSTVRLVFPTISKFNHACIPNARIEALHPDIGPSVVKAMCDIPKGAEITLNYLAHGMKSARARREELYRSKMFYCDCNMCTLGHDALRKMPCPKCHPRMNGQFSEDIGLEQQRVSYAALELSSNTWICSACKAQWTEHEFSIDSNLTYVEEAQMCSEIMSYVGRVYDDCFYDLPSGSQRASLEQYAYNILGFRHWATLYLDFSVLDQLTTQLLEFSELGFSSDTHEDLAPEVQPIIAAYATTAQGLLARLVATSSVDYSAASFVEYFLNAAYLLCEFRDLDVALQVAKFVRPYVTSCMSASVKDSFNRLLQKCERRSNAQLTNRMIFHSNFPRITDTGDLHLDEIEHYKMVAGRHFKEACYSTAAIIYSGLCKSAVTIDDEHRRQDMVAVLHSNAAQCFLKMEMWVDAQRSASESIAAKRTAKAEYRLKVAEDQLALVDCVNKDESNVRLDAMD